MLPARHNKAETRNTTKSKLKIHDGTQSHAKNEHVFCSKLLYISYCINCINALCESLSIPCMGIQNCILHMLKKCSTA
jgi:hypothetical protein